MARIRRVFLYSTLFDFGSRRPRRSPLVSISLLLAWLLPFGAGAGAFKWVDDEGNVHYGDSRPPEHEVEAIRTPLPPPPVQAVQQSHDGSEDPGDQAAAKDQEGEKKREAEQAAAREEDERKQRCSQAQSQLRTLEFKGVIYHLDEQGKRVYLDKEERETRLERAREEVKANCR